MTGGKTQPKCLHAKMIIVIAQIIERFFVLVLSCTPFTEVLNTLQIWNFRFQILNLYLVDLVDNARVLL